MLNKQYLLCPFHEGDAGQRISKIHTLPFLLHTQNSPDIHLSCECEYEAGKQNRWRAPVKQFVFAIIEGKRTPI